MTAASRSSTRQSIDIVDQDGLAELAAALQSDRMADYRSMHPDR